MIRLSLPWPPSVNHYWRQFRGRVYTSAEGKRYRKTVALIAATMRCPSFAGDQRLRVHVEAYPPDKRRRDIDNVLKALNDALEHAGVFVNDSQIDDLRIRRGPVVSPGSVDVAIEVVG